MPTVHPERTIRTHANIVHLAGDLAYKLKKPVRYPFLDYSTPELRRRFIQEEFRLNRRFSPDIYLGVVEVQGTEPLQIGPLLSELPPDSAAGDFAVVMRRIPDDCWLPALCARGELRQTHLDALMALLVQTWREHPADDAVRRCGMPDVLARNTVANVAECRRFVPQLLSGAVWTRLDALLRGWIGANPAVFETRVAQDRIRDGHGDLKPGNIAFVDGRPVVTDCIEFNPQFRRMDTLAEAAFLATGLQSLGQFEAAAQAFAAYRRAARDEFPDALRRYYQAHFAAVMGKVTALQLDDPAIESTQRQVATGAARAYFGLADFFAREPHVILVGGIMGCGKSTLSLALSRATGWPVWHSDVLRKELWGVAATERLPASAYTDEAAVRVYQALAARVSGAGAGVILDAQWPAPELRRIGLSAARRAGAAVSLVLCDAPDDVVRARMDRRERDPGRVSDATSELLAAARARFVPPGAEEGADVLRLDTTGTVELSVARVLQWLVRPC
ncbi:MAG: AAA family ATPase [Planctomycetes bacterium]|nr:AAA family ATPase [Planctomycetota bacterium]MCL4729134.1 AAA family ATPase [Planctomycetota bacterium]